MRSVFAFLKEPLHLNQRQKWRQWLTYRFLGTIGVIGMTIVVTFFIFQQKFQNDQIELAQPDTSLTFEGNLAALPLFGQTFVPRQAGLRGIYLPISIEAEKNGTGGLNLHLRSSPEATEDIRTATLSIADLEGQRLARFTFEPLPDSLNTRYYFFIEPSAANDETTINLYYSGPTTYINGALYLDGEPQESQASFSLAYDRRLILQDWGNWLINNSLNLLAILLLTTLPGAALLLWLWPKDATLLQNLQMNHIEWLALTSGLSVAIYPILLLWGNVIGLKFGPGIILALLILSGLSLIGKIYFRFRQDSSRSVLEAENVRSNLIGLKNTLLSPPILLFWLIFLLSAGVRIFVVRGQEVPLWQDSYHHSMISQLIVDNGGLFNSWEPYAPIKSFSYHFGFHTFVAMYHWLTDSNTIFQSVLATGQLMNLLTVLMAFLLGRRFGGSDWAGTFAALITGLLSEHPMFYANWGRYTQLTGQVILPLMMILTWLAFKTQKLNYKMLALLTLGLAGLALTHYRVLFFYPCFVAALLLVKWVQADGALRSLRRPLLYSIFTAIGSLIIVAPWLWRIVGSRLWDIHSTIIAEKSGREVAEAITIHPSIFDFMMPSIVIMAALGVVWGCWQRQPGILAVAGWTLGLLVLANPHFLYLPGTDTVTYFAVLIAGYLPLSIVAGFTLSEIARKGQSFHPVVGWCIVVLALWAGTVGLQARVSSIEYGNGMVTKPDLAAMEWIKENTPTNATFWINARVGYVSLVVGTDAGWWIPLLTGRQGFILPMIADTERIDPPDHTAQIYELYQRISAKQFDLAKLWRLQRDVGITHIYVGQRRGEVWRGSEQSIDPLLLNNSSYYKTLYHQDQVWIFALCQDADAVGCDNDS